jgi:hypothetical protein
VLRNYGNATSSLLCNRHCYVTMEMHQTHCYATVTAMLLWKWHKLVAMQQALSRYYGNAIWCIDHVTKENLICHSMYEKIAVCAYVEYQPTSTIHDPWHQQVCICNTRIQPSIMDEKSLNIFQFLCITTSSHISLFNIVYYLFCPLLTDSVNVLTSRILLCP